MTHEMPDQNHIGMHTLGRNISRYIQTTNSISFFPSHKCTHSHSAFVYTKTKKKQHAKLIACTNLSFALSLALSPLLVVLWRLQSSENISTDLDHSHHHYHRHRRKMMITKTLAGQEHNPLVHWLRLCLMIRIYRAGCQRITLKKVLNGTSRLFSILSQFYFAYSYCLYRFSRRHLRLLCG